MREPQPFVSRSIREAPGVVLDEVRAHLDDGEEVLAVVGVVKIFPTLDIVVITPWRVLAGLRVGLRKAESESWKVALAREDVAGVEVTGFMDNVRFVLGNGLEIKVGNLLDGDDERPLRQAMGLPVPEREPGAQEPPEGSGDALSSLDDLLTGPVADTEPDPEPSAATWELYDPPPPAHHRHRRR